MSISNRKTSAILLVGGMGTRLQPLTNNSPKPMLPVGGVPFTEHQIVKARESGISEIVLATSYLAEIFQPYFGDGSKFGIQIKYAVEEVALGTGGAIRNAAKLLSPADQVVIFNGDVLSAHDLPAQIKFHEEKAADVTLYLTEVADARAYGSVELLAGDRVKSFLEKMENPPSNLINAGCYVFNRSIIDAIPDGEVISVERQSFPQLLAADKKVFGFVDRSYWLDIGTPAALIKASKDLITGTVFSAATPAHDGDSIIADSASIAADAKIIAGSNIQPQVVVESNCEITASIIGEGATIGANSKIIDSFIAPNTKVPAGTVAINNYLGF
jgi:mannose-1-phosphate guanylyltransferase